jgi:predicted transcriptional regulator
MQRSEQQRAIAVATDASTFRKALPRGERAIEEGRVVTQAKAKKRMARWLK